jgi:hypothetical protein
VLLVTDDYGRQERLTPHISWCAPLLFLPGGDYAGSFPKQSTVRRAAVASTTASPNQSRDAQRRRREKTGTDLYTRFVTFPVLFEKKGYVRATVRIIPLKSRLEEFVEVIGEVIRQSLFPS